VTVSAADFIESVLIDPETLTPFALTEAERVFLDHAFEQGDDGRLKYPELLFSAPKKSGKTGFAAMLLIYVVRILGGRYAEGLCCANDFEQASGRVFTAAARMIEASPLLRQDARVTAPAQPGPVPSRARACAETPGVVVSRRWFRRGGCGRGGRVRAG
jgi:hypothetical protein